MDTKIAIADPMTAKPNKPQDTIFPAYLHIECVISCFLQTETQFDRLLGRVRFSKVFVKTENVGI